MRTFLAVRIFTFLFGANVSKAFAVFGAAFFQVVLFGERCARKAQLPAHGHK